MKQRILSMILVVVMVFTSVDITAFAQEQIGVEVATATEDEEVKEEEEGQQEDGTTAPMEEVTEEPSGVPDVEPTEEPIEEAAGKPTTEVTIEPSTVPAETPELEDNGQIEVTPSVTLEPSLSPESTETPVDMEDPEEISPSEEPEASATPEKEPDASASPSMAPIVEESTFEVLTHEGIMPVLEDGSLTPDDIVVADDQFAICAVDLETGKLINNTIIYIDNIAYETNGVIYIKINQEDLSEHSVWIKADGYTIMPYEMIKFVAGEKHIMYQTPYYELTYVKGVLTRISTIPAVWIDEVQYICDDEYDINEAGAFLNEYVICVLKAGKVIEVRLSTPPAVTEYYGTPKYKTTPEERIQKAVNEYCEAMDEYLRSIVDAAKEDVKDAESSYASAGKKLREADEASNDRIITLQAGTPEIAIDSTYQVLAMMFEDWTEEGIDLGKVDLDDDEIVISTKILNKILNNISSPSITRKVNGYTVSINIFMKFGGAYTGQVVVYGPKGYFTGAINSRVSDTAEVMTEYLNEMSNMVNDLHKQALLSVITELGENIGIGEITKKEIKEIFNDKLVVMKKGGYGNVLKRTTKLIDLYEKMKLHLLYEDAKDIYDSYEEIRDLYEELKELDHSDDDVTKGPIRKAIEKLKSAKSNLVDELYNYLYNIDPPEDESFGDWFKRVFIQCPVDFEVYSSGTCIGYVKNGTVYSDSDIKIEVDGDVKTLYVPGEMDININFVGTGTGVMNYVLEEYQSGQPIGRMNYYDIPLTEGITYSQKIESKTWNGYVEDFPIIAENGEYIYADEYLMAVNMDASVSVSCSVDEGGTVVGEGTYPKGDPVKLSAYTIDSAYRFVGWYVNDTLVAEETCYYFTAIEDVSVRAAFEKKEENSTAQNERNSDYKTTLYGYYEEFAAVHVYKNASGYDDIAIRVLGANQEDDFSKIIIKGYTADGVETLNQEKATVFDDEFSYWIKNINMSNYAKIELYHSTGQMIASIVYVENYLELEDLIVTENMSLYGDFVCANLEISNDATLNLNGHTLMVADDAIISGTVNMGTGKLTVVGKVNSLNKNVVLDSGEVKVYGDVVSSSLKLQNCNVVVENNVDVYGITLNNSELRTYGNATNNGWITFNNGKFLIKGDLTYTGISMSSADDMLEVKGDFVGNSNTSSGNYSLTDGTIRLYGNVYHNEMKLLTSGMHKVVFCGTEEQRIKASLLGWDYNIVEFLNENIVLEGYFSAEKVISDMNCKSENASISIGDLNGYKINVDGNTSLFGKTNLNGGEFYVNGDITIIGQVSLANGSLSVKGNLVHDVGGLSIDGGTLYVQEDLLIRSTLLMENDNDIIDVDGNITIERDESKDNVLTAGTIKLAGNFDATGTDESGKFECSDTHKFILDGTEIQEVKGIGKYDKFNELIVNNQQNIKVSGYLQFAKLIGDISIVGDNLIIKSDVSDLLACELINVNGNEIIIYGDVEIFAGIDLAGGKLEVLGNVSQPSGEMIINGGQFIVDGDYSLQPILDEYNAYTASRIIMKKENDLFEVKGDFYLQDDNYWKNNFQAGTMRLHGDIRGNYKVNYPYVLECTGTHKTVFCGEQEQHVLLGEKSKFNEVEFQNDNLVIEEWFNAERLVNNGKIKTEGTNAKIGWIGFNGKTLEVEGDVEVRAIINCIDDSESHYIPNNYFSMAEGKLCVKGNLSHSAGNIFFDGGEIHVTGNYYSNDSENVWKVGVADSTVQNKWGKCSLIMKQDKDILDVDGNLQIISIGLYNYVKAPIETGTIYVGGDLIINSKYENGSDTGCKYDMQGTNKVVLDGDKHQKITLDTLGSEFNTVQLTKDLSNYTFYPNPCWKKFIEKDGEEPTEGELWYENWDYTLDGTEIILRKFNEGIYGTNTEIVIPAMAEIDDKVYNVVLQGTNDFFETTFSKSVTSITVKKGVQAAEDISYLFKGCENLIRLDINDLDTSNVINMDNLFRNCKNIQLLDLNGMNTSKVEDMDCMFRGCENLIQLNISEIDTSNVTDMSYIFYECKNLTEINISQFDTSSVTSMFEMFYECNELREIDLSSFDTRNVTSMRGMFYRCNNLKKLDLSGFDTSKVYDMAEMFSGCQSLTEVDVASFDTGNVENMQSMFNSCENLVEVNVSNFDTSKVTDMSNMFWRCLKLDNINVSNFNTGKVNDLGGMFAACGNLKSLDLSGFDTSNVESMRCMFEGCKSLVTLDLTMFDTDNVDDMFGMFWGCNTLETIIFGDINTEKVNDMSSMFEDCYLLNEIDISEFDTSNVERFESMFKDCYSISELKISNFNTHNATNMSEMFSGCQKLKELEVSVFDTVNVTTMKDMFKGCERLEDLNVGSFKTEIVSDMSGMFAGCRSLKAIDVQNFDTKNVKYMNEMFWGCESLQELDVTSFSLDKVTDMENMFRGCKKVSELNLSEFKTNSVISMRNMFDGCETLQELDLSGFDISKCGSYALDSLLRNTVSLKRINTPVNVRTNAEVSLFGVYRDVSEQEYSILPEAMSSSMLLVREDIEVEVESINVSGQMSTMKINSISPFKIDVTCYPENATDQRVSILSSDPSIATIDSMGRAHSYDKLGNVTITITSISNPEVSSSFEIEVIHENIDAIALDKENLDLKVGETERLDVSISQGFGNNLYDNYIWTSNDETIATVDTRGNVLAVSEGTTAIVCTYKYDESITASCQVTVTPRVAVEGLSLSEETVTVEKNYAVILKATISPSDATNKNIIWVSSDEAIATVNSKGIVVGRGAGETEIIAKSADNEAIYDSCKVTVIAQRIPVQYVLLDQYSITLKEGQEQKITARVYPDNADNQNITWKSSNSSVVTVNQDGVVSAKQAGTAYITATAEDGNITAYCQVKVTAVYATEVVISNKEKMLEVGQEHQLSVELVPADSKVSTWYWFSSDESIAKVSDTGKVTAVKEGSCVITVQSDDARLQATCTISVIKEGTVKYKNLWIYGIDNVNYTGAKQTHVIRVFDGEKELTEGKDYTCSYENNKVAYVYTDEDYALFEEKLRLNGKSVTVGTFNPKKAPQVTIKMKGNYSGSKTIYFKINQENIEGDDFKVDNLTVTYTGKKQTPVPTLKWNNKKLKYGTDFYIPEYDSAKNDKKAFTTSQTYNLTILGKKNYKGEIPLTLTISESKKQVAISKVSVKGIKDLQWTGEQRTQNSFKVTYKKDVLTEANGDYTISWGTNTDVGIGTVTLTGTGEDADGDGYSYIGTKTVSFMITGTSMSKVTVTGINKKYTYTGSEIMPEAVLTYKANKKAEPITLVKNTHYTVDYKKNTEKGIATIIYKGLPSSGYTGTKKVTFKIVANKISIEQVNVRFKDIANMQNGIYVAPYMKGGVKPEIVVTNDGKILKKGKDYTISYSNNKKVALATSKSAPTITIKGIGNYSGSRKQTFTIAVKRLSNGNGITIVAKDKIVSTKKNGYKQSFKVYDADGKALGSGDYNTKDVTYTLIRTENADGTVNMVNQALNKNSVVPANSVIRITVYGKGNYVGGAASGTYRILEKSHDISKAIIQINNQTYTGDEILITNQGQFKPGKVYIKIGNEKKELMLGKDIEVVPDSYVKNVKKGTAKVTFRGINDFGGTKTVSYKIGTRSITGFWEGVYGKVAMLFG